MNPDLYTEEFRHFKYLKSSAFAVDFYKRNAILLNNIQPWEQVNDPNFVWETRLEFIEQLFDLRQDTVYIVQPPSILCGYDNNSRIYEIKTPFIYKGSVPQVEKEATLEDISALEEDTIGYYLTSASCDLCDKIFLTMDACQLIPSSFSTYAALFYNKEWAIRYKDAITFFLRKNTDAITAIARRF